LLLLTGVVHGEAIPETFRLVTVKFEGVHSIPKGKLAETLASKIHEKWKFWKPKPVLNRSDLEEDLLRIKRFYEQNGYYQSEGTVAFKMTAGEPTGTDKPPSLAVIFSVTEGPPVKISEVLLTLEKQVEGITQASLLSRLPFRPGQIFVTSVYQDGKKRLTQIFGNRGYPKVTVDGKVLVDTETNSAGITLKIDPGRPYRIGELKITGNDGYVKDIIIRRAVQFKSGQMYRADKVEQSQRNLHGLDVFQTALVGPGEPVEGEDSIPMEVQVKPKKRQSVEFGIGYGTEDGLRLRGGWSYRNLLGWGGKFSITARRSDLIETIQGGYHQPYFMDADTTFDVKAGFERENQESYNFRKIFTTGALERSLWGNWTGSFGYNLEISKVDDLKVTDPVDRRAIEEENRYFISSVLAGLSRNTTDNEINSTKGSLVSLSVEQASEVFGSEVSFFQPALELRKFILFPQNVVLAGRIRFETVQETEDTDGIPIFKRLYLGGSNTVRGYGYQKLGPLDTNGNPLGGLTALNGNLEVRFPLYKKLSGVFFVDMGLLDEDAFSFESGDLRFAGGTGIRYHTPIGPIRLDFGYKLNPPKLGEVAVTDTPDEDIEDRWQIHFSIGQTF